MQRSAGRCINKLYPYQQANTSQRNLQIKHEDLSRKGGQTAQKSSNRLLLEL